MTDYLCDIRSALAAREGALAAWRHSRNSTTSAALHTTHRALDIALDDLWSTMTPAERRAVDKRAVKVLAQV